MNRYDEIKSYDVDQLAAFIYSTIATTEEVIVGQLSALGIDVSLCSLNEDVRIAKIKNDLLEEPDDT